MRKLTVTQGNYNRYLIAQTTSGATHDYEITDGEHTIMLDDCLIFEQDCFSVREFDDIVTHLQQQQDGVGIDEFEGWTLLD